MNFEESWPAFLLYTEEGMELVLGRGGATVSELDRQRLWDFLVGCGVYGPEKRERDQHHSDF